MFRSKKGKHDWSNDGNFMSKPKDGWIHPDEQLLPNAGVCYGVKYIGSMRVLESMRTLDFDTRTALTMECISRLCYALGLRPNKKFKKMNKLDEYLGPNPNVMHSCIQVNLTITTDYITIVNINNMEKICNHQMTSVSFASGGDQETRDFVAYVAKDDSGRSCHVIECLSGLAEQVISTIGQAFEIRFKNYLSNKTLQMPIPEQITPEVQYYNDHPDDSPESEVFDCPMSLPPRCNRHEVEYQSPRSNLPVKNPINYVNESNNDSVFHFNHNQCSGIEHNPSKYDPFSANAFVPRPSTCKSKSILPYDEIWFHGKISRPQAEELLINNGDFLVRESPGCPGQFVLSGKQGVIVRHLLLVDPEGKVRTKDMLFNSVGHLVNYHLFNKVPIISMDNELLLKHPIIRRE